MLCPRLTSCIGGWLVLTGACLAAAPEGNYMSRVEGLNDELVAITKSVADDRVWEDKSPAFEAAYRRWLPDPLLERFIEEANEPALSALFNTTYTYLLRVQQPDGTGLTRVFNGLEEKGWANDKTIELMHRFYLTIRDFDEARVFRRKHPQHGLPAPPPIIPMSSIPPDDARTVLAFLNSGLALQRETVNIDTGAKVIVIADPQCHFFRDAVDAIDSDQRLSEAMNKAAIWLTTPFKSLTDGAVFDWNQREPAYAFRYVEYKSDWPEMNAWGSPTFYFFRDGRLMKKVAGWAMNEREHEEQMEALRAGLRAIGVAQ